MYLYLLFIIPNIIENNLLKSLIIVKCKLRGCIVKFACVLVMVKNGGLLKLVHTPSKYYGIQSRALFMKIENFK